MNIEPFKLERYFALHEFSVKYLLSSSDCESIDIHHLLSFEPNALSEFLQLKLGYTESAGNPILRKEICSLYSSISPEQVLVHTGAEEAIFLFMHAHLQAGDHIIVHSPCYQSLRAVAKSIGCEICVWEAQEGEGWCLDVSNLEKKLKKNTKAIVINIPHNPTGYVMPHDVYGQLHRLIQKHGILLFCDEVYRESEYDIGDRLPAAVDVSDLSVSLGVMSKTYGLPGLRIGWITTKNKELLRKMAALKDYTTICNSGPSEFLATLALRYRKSLVAKNVCIMTENKQLLDDFFSTYSDIFEWVKPKAGSIAFPKLRKTDAETFSQFLLKNAEILLVPGTMFGEYPYNFRIGFGRTNFSEGLAHLETFISFLI